MIDGRRATGDGAPAAVLVPATLLLLPEYAGAVDPAPELRAACDDAVAALVATDPPEVAVLGAATRPDNVARGVPAAGPRIARHLLASAGWTGEVTGPGPGVPLLVVGNGSACRSERAPGHLDPRAGAFDTALGAALVARDTAALAGLDARLAEQLWCHDVPAFTGLAAALPPGPPAEVAYDDDPFGVQYWVLRWS